MQDLLIPPTTLELLRQAKDKHDLASLLGIQVKTLTYVLYSIEESEKYTNFDIPKKSGGHRQISSPHKTLKFVQRRLADVLQKCHDEAYKIPNLEQKLDSSGYIISHGFQPRMSILTNAKYHVKKRYVFNLDLESFFPSFNFGRVYSFFIKNNLFKCDYSVAALLAQLVTHNGRLPQGAPTSPVISNLITRSLDIRLLRLAKTYNCFYTRYADDLTFSTNEKKFPIQLYNKQEDGAWIVGKKLNREIEKSGFSINLSKVRLQEKHSRQEVTGIVVNKVVNVNQRYYRYVRSMCHELFKSGNYALPSSFIRSEEFSENINDLNILTGVLNHILNVKSFREKFSDRSQTITINGIKRLWIKFNFFKHFYALEKPLIFCEGKTDNIYLKAAIRQLSSNLSPSLCSGSEKTFKYNVGFFNFSQHFHDSCSFAPGTGGQKHLIREYVKYLPKFKCEGKRFPVIIVSDNDKDGRGVDDAAQELKKRQHGTSRDGYTHIYANLYHVLLPNNSQQKNTTIENLLPENIFDQGIDGRRVNLGNNKTENNEIGKLGAAEYIFKNQSTVDFSGFQNTLDIINKIILDYASRSSK